MTAVVAIVIVIVLVVAYVVVQYWVPRRHR